MIITWKECHVHHVSRLIRNQTNWRRVTVQGTSKRLFPGCENVGWKNCVLLPAVGKQNATFSPNFTKPGKSLWQGAPKECFPGLVNFVSAVAYHLCLNLPRAFSQPGKHSFGDPCRGSLYCTWIEIWLRLWTIIGLEIQNWSNKPFLGAPVSIPFSHNLGRNFRGSW